MMMIHPSSRSNNNNNPWTGEDPQGAATKCALVTTLNNCNKNRCSSSISWMAILSRTARSANSQRWPSMRFSGRSGSSASQRLMPLMWSSHRGYCHPMIRWKSHPYNIQQRTLAWCQSAQINGLKASWIWRRSKLPRLSHIGNTSSTWIPTPSQIRPRASTSKMDWKSFYRSIPKIQSM